ncbi:MAG: Chromate transport protein ChrA [uncultured Rubrobacteraceae bacterium]|uniref:Chromate transport protein ChrA n=1 Tax=uncultured Rubrobacteraceae bacterium TaxID=349277 RepID=A0A6J4QZW1_9ACTN|nr:MAG: Chromate transport protein ChrA [uncultured Rubrobacteraceae bacterium]
MEGKNVGFREAFLFWVKLGFINFGGTCRSDLVDAPRVGRA